MSTRGVGFLLILTATIALGALAQDYRIDTLIAAEQATGRALDGQVRDLDHSLTVLQSAEQASVAKGQTPGDWLDRSATLTADIETALSHQR